VDVLLAIDLGTSSTRAALYRADTASPVPDAFAQRQHTPTLTPDGGMTLNPEALVQEVRECIAEAQERAPRGTRIIGAGLSGFWHSAIGIDENGEAQTPVLLWSDTRSAPQVARLKAERPALPQTTGCPWHSSYLYGRLTWLKETQPRVFAHCERFVSPPGYVLGRLFGFEGLQESPSMASATGLWDQTTQHWLPEWKNSLFPVGDTPLGDDFPWFPAIGDGAASSAGVGAIGPERLALMIGTSGALRAFGTRGAGVPSLPAGLWRYQLAADWFALGGGLTNGGSLWAWLEKTLNLGDLAAAPPDAHGLTVLPFLAGERAPLWRDDLCGAIVGLSTATTPDDIARAHLEAMAYRFASVRDLLRPLAPHASLIATGAALKRSTLWPQILADVLCEPLLLCAEDEGSARGAALWARERLGLGAVQDAPTPPIEATIAPDPARHSIYQEARQRHEALLATLARSERPLISGGSDERPAARASREV
jgi:gluconokinase